MIDWADCGLAGPLSTAGWNGNCPEIADGAKLYVPDIVKLSSHPQDRGILDSTQLRKCGLDNPASIYLKARFQKDPDIIINNSRNKEIENTIDQVMMVEVLLSQKGIR